MSMRRLTWVVGLGLIVSLLWFFWPRTRRVLWVAVDAGADYLLDEYLADGTLSADGGFAELIRRGARAEAATPIDISMTAPSFATLYTGSYPEKHGLVGNTYYRVTEPLRRTSFRPAWDVPFQAEPLWTTLRRAGKEVVLIGNAIGVDPKAPPEGLHFLGFPSLEGLSALVEREREQWAKAAGWDFAGRHFEAALASQISFPTQTYGKVLVHLLAVDTTDDGNKEFNRVILDFDRNLGNGVAAELQAGAWAAVRLPVEGERAVGAWVKLLELTPDLARLRLYRGPVYRNVGAPAEFLSRIEETLGFSPGWPDTQARGQGWLDEETWVEQVFRLSRYLREAALLVLERGRFDLLLVYQPNTDHVAHRYLLRDPRQPGYADAATRERAENYLKRAWREVDETLRAVMAAAGPNTDVVVTADHGMIPVHTTVYANRLLQEAGWSVTGEHPQMMALTSGAQAHIYVNLFGRQSEGVVQEAEYDTMVTRAVEAFARLRDPQTGDPVCEVVAKRDEMGDYHILHEATTGDVWVSLKPGYIFSSNDQPGPLFGPARGGTHGYLGRFRRMQTIFVAAGPHIRPTELGVVENVDMAPTVAAILEVPPPADAQGRVLTEILRNTH
jgi:predicted AlkP superfamily pyrophosphatase or phosphodiesterase